MGIKYLSLARFMFSKAEPFTSKPLDKLAQTMGANAFLKKNKNARYYLAKGNGQGCTALFNGTIVFDKKYYNMLAPEERLAIGAHEFNHIVKKHSIRAAFRISVPSLIVLVSVILLASVAPTTYQLFQNNGYLNLTQIATAILLLSVFFSSLFLSAPWQRRNETDCDLSAVQYGYGEAMITALTKLNERFPKSKWDKKLYKLFPHTHPPIEQRIVTIKQALQSKHS